MATELNHTHVQALVDARAAAINAREQADAQVKALNAQIRAELDARQLGRLQLITSGAIIQIIRPKDRLTIVAEELLAQGVDPDVIKRATKPTPVASFIRVDLPEVPKGAEYDAATGAPVAREGAPPTPTNAPPAGAGQDVAGPVLIPGVTHSIDGEPWK